ncbi:hypothetical protein E2C01_018038 [Portunus trituberculatus]|uniref:Uncharacterized protein n=1 Tax=Portunus trituberculatus TaxID=210409 RepID=A0A5B7DVQ0_PORTR|nr:hypothetical protein [Portunus trituberculatus]
MPPASLTLSPSHEPIPSHPIPQLIPALGQGSVGPPPTRASPPPLLASPKQYPATLGGHLSLASSYELAVASSIRGP